MTIRAHGGVLVHRRILWRLAWLRFAGWPSEDALSYLVERSNKLLMIDPNPFVAALTSAATALMLNVRDEREKSR